MTEPLLSLDEHVCETFERFTRIDGADRIVRRVDDHRLRLLRDRLLERIEIDLEVVFARRDLNAHTTRKFDPNAVFGEIGRDDDDLIARLDERREASPRGTLLRPW